MSQCATENSSNDFIIIAPKSSNKDKNSRSLIDIVHFSDSDSLDSSEDAENFKEQEMCNYCFCQ